jgi:hypothetical protein
LPAQFVGNAISRVNCLYREANAYDNNNDNDNNECDGNNNNNNNNEFGTRNV